MKRYSVTTVIVLLFFGATGRLDAESYGPGPHWVDSVGTPGAYVFPSALVEFGVDLDLDDTPDADYCFAGGPLTVTYTAALDDSIEFPGTRPIDGHLDVVDTEIESAMLVSGFATLRVGAGAGVSSVPPHVGPWPTLGAVAELPTDPSLAESFFEAFFEVDAFIFGFYHNHEPLVLSTVISQAPPPIGTDFVANQLPLSLYDWSEVEVARLTNLTDGSPAHFMITPEPPTFVLFAIGAVGLAAYGRRKRRPR